MDKVRLALIGAGAIGVKHADAIAESSCAELGAIVDPSPGALALAKGLGVPLVASLEDLPQGIDGAIVATPTQLHYEQAMACLTTGMPVLMEKPVTASLDQAMDLAEAAARSSVPMLVGHHRRHNPRIAAAKATVDGGAIGRVISAQVSVLLCKPDDYFLPDWRRQPGAGPILTNLVHEVDTLRHLLGEIVEVQAIASNAIRKYAVEDSAAVLLRFANGVLATVIVSDAAAAPWSWELTAAENPDYPETGQASTQIAGTEGALEVPSLRLWKLDGPRGWHTPMTCSTIPFDDRDPLVRQVDHFVDVIRGVTQPQVGISDAARTMAVVDAVIRAIESEQIVRLP